MDDSNFCYEHMDVDRSGNGSTNSKMDTSFIASDSEVADNRYIDLTTTNDNKRISPSMHEYIDLATTEDKICKATKISPTIRPRSRSYKRAYFTPTKNKLGGLLKENDSSKIRPNSNIKIYHIKRVPKDKLQSSYHKYLFVAVSFFIVVLLAIFYQLTKLKCVEEIDIRSVRKSLTENLYGQNVAANKIIEVLNMEVSSKIIFLYGGTGVGKTYAVSLMLENIWNSVNIYHYTMPSFADSFSPELMFGLTMCKTSIIVVDGLNRNDVIKTQIQNVISKSENLGKNITIILIYNCDNISENFVKKCDDNFKSQLHQQFVDINCEKMYIRFESLTEEHLKKCILKEFGDRKVHEQEMENILKNFDVSFDGCKGVYNKVKLYNVV